MILERNLNSQKILIQNIDKNIDKIITEIKFGLQILKIGRFIRSTIVNQKSWNALNKRLDLMEKNDSKTKDKYKIENIILLFSD